MLLIKFECDLRKGKKGHYECYHNAKSRNFLVTVLYREYKREIEFPTDLTHYTTMDSPLEHKEYMQFLLAKVSTKVIKTVFTVTYKKRPLVFGIRPI